MHEISNCPICNGDLVITEVKCHNCKSEVRGRFRPNRFNLFSKEQLYFIEVFLKTEGNIKLVEKELGISYPTVKGKLQKVIETLGYTSRENKGTKEEMEEKSRERLKALKSLKDGKSNFKDTLNKLGELK